MIQNNDAAFTLCLDNIHFEHAHHKIPYTHLSHGAGEHAKQGSDDGNHSNCHKNQSFSGFKEIIKSIFDKLHAYLLKLKKNNLKREGLKTDLSFLEVLLPAQ